MLQMGLVKSLKSENASTFAFPLLLALAQSILALAREGTIWEKTARKDSNLAVFPAAILPGSKPKEVIPSIFLSTESISVLRNVY